MRTQHHIAVIGAGPAGLRAAESAVLAGANVTIYDAKPGPGRKLLVAGKSGLNLTYDESPSLFQSRYSGPELPRELWNQILNSFDNRQLREWCHQLGFETFVSNSGKVFPEVLKTAPILRQWISRLKEQGVTLSTKHKLIGLETTSQPPLYKLTFETPEGLLQTTHSAVILALGGASWPKTGSDAKWLKLIKELGISYNSFGAANSGWEVNWPAPILEQAEGSPLKNLVVHAGEESTTGELMITKYGLEGSAIYRLGKAIRTLPSPHILIDFKPSMTETKLISKLGKTTKGFVREAKYRWKLSSATTALLKHLPDRGPWRTATDLAREVKSCRIPLLGPRPMEEAISSYGGICWNEIDNNLMLKKLPGVFVCGEMMDWEAPTGGYLLQACFATGSWAGHYAAKL